MYILKNAYANIFRNKGRNLLISIIMFCIIFFSMIAIVYHHTGEVLQENIKQEIGSEIFININRMDESSSHAKPMSLDMLQQIQQMKQIKDIQMFAQAGFHTHTFQVLDDQATAEIKGSILAMSKQQLMKNFEKNNYQIIKGNTYPNKGEVIVSKQLAKLNGWDIGQKITLENASKELLILKIAGIFDDMSMQAYQNNYGIPSSHIGNHMYTNLDTLLASQLYQKEGLMDLTVHLHHAQDLESLKKDLQAIHLPSYYSIRIDEEKLKSNLEPVLQMKQLSEKLMFGVWSVGGIIFLLICVMSIRERVYEIGVLRAMGMKKKYIALGIFYEYLILVSLVLCIGILCTFICAQPLANILLSQNNVSITIPLVSLIEIIAISIFLVLFSSAIAIMKITRLEPAKLLQHS